MKNNKSNPAKVTANVDRIPTGVTEETPGHNTDTGDGNEAAGEISTVINATLAIAPDAAPQSAHRPVRLPIHEDFELSQAMLDSVEQQARMSIPGMERGARYTTKRICGKAFWKMLTKGEKILAGICMSHLVATNRLPLIEAGSNASHAKVYELK